MDNFPVQALSKAQRVMAPSPARALVFDTEKQRNTQFLNKGLSKPGRVTFEVLRRAVQSTHIARICVNVLKEKVTKTEWIIKSIDRNKVPKDDRIEVATELIKHPTLSGETFRTLLDKILEDLLILDVAVMEKTRYPDGTLAELHYVDGSTIRPVFDEYGNQDIEIPMTTPAGQVELPTSYIQVMDNSQYGGPESGQVVGSWPKKDMIRFMMHPQGSMIGIGYGLSPIESVVTVVANILNADNFNATYFEEGSFPPVIIQLLGQVNQRDIQLYREYLQSELSGNYHRPAIMAGGTDAKVLNLKDLTNRDMEFMEYMKFMARLLAAAYGLSGQDIGLTEEVGSKNVSETQKAMTNEKGYGSILHLLKEIINQEIIWKDFGYTDIEFDWVADDSIDPKDAAVIYDTALKNGTVTLNEVRQKTGFEPYGDWANKPMVLTGEGYKPIIGGDNGENESGNKEGEDDEGGEHGDSAKANTEEEKMYAEEGKAEEEVSEQADINGDRVVGGERKYSDQGRLPDKKKSFATKLLEKIGFKKNNVPTQAEATDFQETPVMFGNLVMNDALKDYVKKIFHMNDVGGVSFIGMDNIGHTYNLESAKVLLVNAITSDPSCFGGIIKEADIDKAKYTVYIKKQ
jgi:hypothetical protein